MIQIINKNFTDAIKKLHSVNFGADNDKAVQNVLNIKNDVLRNRDQAVLNFTATFDKVDLASFNLRVSEKEFEAAYSQVSNKYISAIKEAQKNIRVYHELQLPKSWSNSPKSGVEFGAKFTPIKSAGLYVPGGRAAYPSTVLMNAIPAMIAGVERVVMVTPPQADGTVAPSILVAADICGVKEIYKVGGAQAVFGLAFGTETIPKVDKIVGPGNMYVTMAKQMAYGFVDIDKPAGPSEVMVFIDDQAHAAYAAADMLAQLEHDPLATAITVSEDLSILEKVQQKFETLYEDCARKEVLASSRANAVLFHTKDRAESLAVINQFAAEHLIILSEEAAVINQGVKNAGGIFLGPHTPVTLGDYYAGPNHVLPTSGTARFASPLGVMDFFKYSSTLRYDKQNLEQVAANIKELTALEGLDAHYLAIKVRLS